MRPETTMYMLDSSMFWDPDLLGPDAEQRARDRGCECIRPSFSHYLPPTTGGTYICVVDHHGYCPLAPIGAAS